MILHLGTYKKYLVLLVFLLLAACSGGEGGLGDTGSAGLSWAAPSGRENGNTLSLSEIAGYRIYYGVQEGVFLDYINISDASATQANISGVPLGKYFVVMTTLDVNGLESQYSPVLEVMVI